MVLSFNRKGRTSTVTDRSEKRAQKKIETI